MSYLWASPREAEDALLLHLGHARLENTTIQEMRLQDLAGGLTAIAPAIVHILATGQTIAVPAPGRVLAHDGTLARVSWKQVRDLWEAPARARETAVFQQLGVSPKALGKVVERRIALQPVARVTHFAAPPGSGFASQLQAAGWFRRLGAAVAAHTLGYGIGLTAWALMGQAAMSGRWDAGWFHGWTILLALNIALEASVTWWQGWVSVGLGGLLKQRLLAGSLEIDSDRIRHQGVGQLLSRVLESDILESLGLAGGIAAVLACVEVVAAAVVMSFGAAAAWTLSLFGLWIALVAVVAWRFTVSRKLWVEQRNQLTNGLVEKMNGHRTRIAQQPPSLWHTGEDLELVDYLRTSTRMDRLHAWLIAVGPRGWLVAGMAAIGVAFSGTGSDSTHLAIAIGGVILGYQALRRMVAGLGQLAGAWQAWQMVRDLFHAAAEAEEPASRNAAALVPSTQIMDISDVAYTYPGRDRKVLNACSLRIRQGDRLLLEGLSGGGKSTLGAILAGLRRPTQGLLMSGGVDFATVGAQGWRRRVATAPQYHENHMLAAPLQFNLLMGRAWPPSPDDLREAWAVCKELGLGPLLERMPAGIAEMVGDTGWQLSQGERSRVYLARAILQNAPLVILDESFAALDPETLELCLECVLRRAPSLLVIAHP